MTLKAQVKAFLLFLGEQKSLQQLSSFHGFFLVAITAQDAAEMDGHRNR